MLTWGCPANISPLTAPDFLSGHYLFSHRFALAGQFPYVPYIPTPWYMNIEKKDKDNTVGVPCITTVAGWAWLLFWDGRGSRRLHGTTLVTIHFQMQFSNFPADSVGSLKPMRLLLFERANTDGCNQRTLVDVSSAQGLFFPPRITMLFLLTKSLVPRRSWNHWFKSLEPSIFFSFSNIFH